MLDTILAIPCWNFIFGHDFLGLHGNSQSGHEESINRGSTKSKKQRLDNLGL